MLIEFLIGVAVLVALLALFVATRPAAGSRSAVIPTPASVLFADVSDFHRWEAWSPWAKLDPDAVNTYSGAESGAGAVFRWSGNNRVGEGIMTNLESRPNTLVRIKLEFLKPFKATNTAEFIFEPQGNGTRVTWSMTGTNNFVGKAMGLLMNCDKMVGGMFEKGLVNLKTVTEQMTVNR